MKVAITDPMQVVRLKDLDAPGGRPGCGLKENGDLCPRCKGKGWVMFARLGRRYSCPDCLLEEA